VKHTNFPPPPMSPMLLVRLCCISSVLGGMVVVINVTSMISEWFESDVMLFVVVVKERGKIRTNRTVILLCRPFATSLYLVAVCRRACNRWPGCA